MSTSISSGLLLTAGFLLVAGLFLAYFIWMSKVYLDSGSRAKTSGGDGMPGRTGVVKVELAPDGKVKVHGELWNARSINGETIEEGKTVEVMKIEGLVLFVKET